MVAAPAMNNIRPAAANGTTWQQLWERNRGTLSNPNVLRVGQTLAV